MSEDLHSDKAPVSGGERQRRQRTEYRSDGAAAKRGLRFVVLPALALIVLGVAVTLLYKPAKRKYLESRGKTQAVKAAEDFAAGDKVAAVKSLRVALAMAPDDSVVLRNAALILATEDIPDALNFWNKIFLKGEGTTDDRIRYAALAIRLRRYGLAKSELEPLLKAEPNNVIVQRLMMEIQQATGDLAGAIAEARRIVERDGNETNRFVFGQTLVDASRPLTTDGRVTAEQVKWAEEGAKILLPMALNTGPLQSPAAAALADAVTLQGEAARQVLEALAKKTPRTPGDMLSTAVIQSKADPQKSEEAARIVVRELASVDLNQRLRAADWLTVVGRHDLAAQLIRQEDSATNILALYLEMDLAVKNKNWPRIKEVLGQSPPGMSATMTNVLAAAIALNENNATTAEKLLRTATDAANSSISADAELLYIARSAEQIGLPQVALAAHETRLGRGAAVLHASESIFRLTSAEQGRDPQFPGLLRQFPALQARYAATPEDWDIAARYYYVAAIMGRNLPQVQAGLTEYRRQFPDRPESILCLAMVALQTGALAEATRLIEENPIDYAALPVRLKALMVHLLGQTGQKELARSYAQKLDLSQYYYEERELLRPWLQR